MTAPTSTPWSALAACRGKAPEIVFGEGIQAIAAMKLICAGCPFTGIGGKCLDDCREVGDEHFVRGGMTPAERKKRGFWKMRNVCRFCNRRFTGRRGATICHDIDCRRKAHNERQRNSRANIRHQRQASGTPIAVERAGRQAS